MRVKGSYESAVGVEERGEDVGHTERFGGCRAFRQKRREEDMVISMVEEKVDFPRPVTSRA